MYNVSLCITEERSKRGKADCATNEQSNGSHQNMVENNDSDELFSQQRQEEELGKKIMAITYSYQ